MLDCVMNKLVSTIFKLLPELTLKNHARCFFYNRMQKDFKIFFKDNIFHVEKEGLVMKFVENPYHILLTDKDYFIKSSLDENDIVLDAGAYVGIFSVYASKKVGREGKVIAFEPDPDTARRLNKNLELNNASNVEIINKGLWSSDATLVFKAGRELASSFVTEDNVDNLKKIEVPVTTIDNAMKDVNVKNKLFIKMNIEGSEIEALKGAVETIRKYRPYWVIRTNHIVNGKTTDKPVEEFLNQRHYKTITKELAELTTFGEPN